MYDLYDSGFRGFCNKEDTDLINFFSWLEWNYPNISPVSFHVMNESDMPVQGRVKAKKKGVKSGVSDIFIMKKTNKYSGLIIELKRKDKSKCKVSKSQKDFLTEMGTEGFKVCVCYGFEQAKKCFLDYLHNNQN